ncbi:MAG: XRE family transcriptional regulator [Planctomycetota bacterium]
MQWKEEAPEAGTLGDRLRAVRRELGLNQTEMGERIGVSQGTVAAYEAGEREPPRPVLLALEHEFSIRPDWLRQGTGEPFARVGPSKPIIATSEEELRRLRRLEGEDQYYAVPYLRDPAAAGEGLLMEDQVEGYCVIHKRVAPHPETLRCVRIAGESMSPTLTDGSIVAVDTTELPMRAVEGKIVCCRTPDGTVAIKRLRLRHRFALLFSDNDDQQAYPPIVIDLREMPDPVIGQVIWAWVDLR